MTTIIVKPTDGCNARCRYCSAAHPGAARRMAPAALEALFGLFGDWALGRGREDLKFIWHGGEPLLMGETFWEEVHRGQTALRDRGIRVENGIQTNATLLRPEMLPTLRRLLGARGAVGTSADPLPGIRELKDAPEGRYAQRLEEGLALLRGAGLRYGLLYVVHRHALPRLGEIYSGFRAAHPGAGLRFNPLYRQGRAGDAPVWDDLGITAEEWGGALVELHRAWDGDGRPANVQPFAPWQQLSEGGAWRLSCEGSGNCAESHFGVDPGGEVHLCGRSADGHTFGMGNLAHLTARDLGASPVFRLVANRRAYLRRTACRNCPWWLYCHGGCVNDAILGSATPFAPTSFCAGLKRFFGEVLPRPGGAVMAGATLSCAAPGAWADLARLAGAPLVLTDLEALAPAEALRFLDFFLHDPAATAPIEPFATLLSAMVAKGEVTLWDLLPPGQAAGDGFLAALPAEHPGCLACACFPVCLGYGEWAGACGTWRALLTALAEASRELERLRNGPPATGGNQVQ